MPDLATSATMMAWEAAGCPRQGAAPLLPAPGRCQVCGADASETVPAAALTGNGTFTDHGLLADRAGTRACAGCAWAMAGRPPQALRLWTVACAPGADVGLSHPKSALMLAAPHPGLLLTARNDMRPVARLLVSPPAAFRVVLGASARLRRAGFTAAEIVTLTPRAGRLTAVTLPVWRDCSAPLAPYRCSALLRLANFMINREHMDEYIAVYAT